MIPLLDADNLIAPAVLTCLKGRLQVGYEAGHRIAKNNDVSIAYLDTISEGINN